MEYQRGTRDETKIITLFYLPNPTNFKQIYFKSQGGNGPRQCRKMLPGPLFFRNDQNGQDVSRSSRRGTLANGSEISNGSRLRSGSTGKPYEREFSYLADLLPNFENERPTQKTANDKHPPLGLTDRYFSSIQIRHSSGQVSLPGRFWARPIPCGPLR